MEAADRGSFHVDEWVFSSVLLPSYEKGDPVRRRLYEAIKNVCHFGLSNVTGKEAGRGNLCKNGRVIRLFSMLEIAFCRQSSVVLEPGPWRVLAKLCSRVDQGKKDWGEALFGFACLRRNARGDDSKTFPNAGPVALCPRCAQGGDDF